MLWVKVGLGAVLWSHLQAEAGPRRLPGTRRTVAGFQSVCLGEGALSTAVRPLRL